MWSQVKNEKEARFIAKLRDSSPMEEGAYSDKEDNDGIEPEGYVSALNDLLIRFWRG